MVKHSPKILAREEKATTTTKEQLVLSRKCCTVHATLQVDIAAKDMSLFPENGVLLLL